MQEWELASGPGWGQLFPQRVPESWELCLQGTGRGTLGVEFLQPQEPILSQAGSGSRNQPQSKQAWLEVAVTATQGAP